VGLRLMGIYFVVESGPLFSAGILIGAFWSKLVEVPGSAGVETSSFIGFGLIPAAVQVLLGILLFFLAGPLARRLISPAADEAKKAVCSLEEVQGIAFGVAGILILSEALPNVGHAWQNLYYWYNNQRASGANPVGSLLYALGILAQIIIGLALLLNPRAFRNIWHWLRTAGTQRRDV